MPTDENWFDDDIALTSLDYGQKAGLQIYKNYTKSFENHAIDKFREALSHEDFNLDDFKRLVNHLMFEDARFILVIICAYADEILELVFKNVIPVDVPGGLRDMLNGYGPLSDLSKRIRLAFAFDILSRDLMVELDRLRKVRNRISHDWNIKAVEDLLRHSNIAEMYPLELALFERGDVAKGLSLETTFRVRLIWLAGRLTYEGAAYYRAKAARLSPLKALYEEGGTTWLKAVSTICMNATHTVADGAVAGSIKKP